MAGSRMVAQIRRATAGRLQSAGVDSFSLETDWMLCHILNCRTEDLILSPDRELSPTETNRLQEFVLRRAEGEPLQYILGETEFYGLRIEVSPDVLIPRPETEGLVQRVLEFLSPGDPGPVADIGTGSGCIALALASERPGLEILAVDISEKALSVARKNAHDLKLDRRIQFVQGNLTAPLRNLNKPFRVLVSNPPYVSQQEMPVLPADVVNHEPHQALFSEESGLSTIDRLILEGHEWLARGGLLALEIGETQGPQVETRLNTSSWTQVRIEKDLAGRDRYALAVSA